MEAQLLADEVVNALQLGGTFFVVGAFFGMGFSWFAERLIEGMTLRLEAKRESAPLSVTEYR